MNKLKISALVLFISVGIWVGIEKYHWFNPAFVCFTKDDTPVGGIEECYKQAEAVLIDAGMSVPEGYDNHFSMFSRAKNIRAAHKECKKYCEETDTCTHYIYEPANYDDPNEFVSNRYATCRVLGNQNK